jgi:transcriptional regulator with XRE-family HTH domain
MAERGLIQAQIAEMARVTSPAVIKWLSGKAVPYRRTAELLAATLGLSSRWLISGEGPREHADLMAEQAALHGYIEMPADETAPAVAHDYWRDRALAAEARLEKIRKILP